MSSELFDWQWWIAVIMFAVWWEIITRLATDYIVRRNMSPPSDGALAPPQVPGLPEDLLAAEFARLEHEVAEREKRTCPHPREARERTVSRDQDGNDYQIIYCGKCRKHLFHIHQGGRRVKL